MSIAQSILDIVREEMARHGASRVEEVNVVAGVLSAIVPSSLVFCFEALVDGTDLAGARLNVRVAPIGYRCVECGHFFEAEELTFTCPRCQADTPVILSGRDMTIENIIAAVDDPPAGAGGV